jgi:hypothetical protein
MNTKDTGRTVYSTLEVPGQLTDEQRAELAALDHRPIDLSDIPELVSGDEWPVPTAKGYLKIMIFAALSTRYAT